MNYLKLELYQLVRESDLVFEQIQKYSSNGLCFWDLENPDHKWLNGALWEQLGYDDPTIHHSSTDWKKVIHPEDFEQAVSRLQEKLSTQSDPIIFELRFFHKDGSEIWFRSHNIPISGKEGKINRMLGFLSNVNRERKLEEDFRKSNERLKKLIIKQSDEVLVFDNQLKIKEWYGQKGPHSLNQIVGKTIIGLNVRDLNLHQNLTLELIHAIQDAKDEEINATFDYRLSNNDEAEMRATVSVLKDDKGSVFEIILSTKDVTEKKLAKKHLHELALVASKTSDLVFITDSKGLISWVNPAFEEKMECSLASINHQRVMEVFGKEGGLESQREALEKAIKSTTPAFLDCLVHSHSGKPVWLELSLDPVFNEAGHCSHFIGIAKDIGQRLEKEKELADIKEILLTTNRVAKIGAWSYNVATDTVFWSDVTKEIHEVAPDFQPTVEKVVGFYQDGQSRQRYFEVGMNAIQNGVGYDEEFKIVSAKGNDVWVRTIGQVEWENGKCKRLFGTFQNIDVFKAAEARVQEASALLKNLTDQAPGVMYQYVLMDSGHAYFPFISQGLEKLMGLSAKEAKSNPNLLSEWMHPDDQERVNKAIIDSYENLSPWKEEFRIRTVNNKIVWVRANSQPVRIDHGVVWHGIMLDITENKLAIEQLQLSEKTYKSLFLHTSDAVMLLDENRFFECNPATLEIFGCQDVNKFYSSHPADVSPEFQPNGKPSREMANERIKTAFENGSHFFDWVHRRLDTGENFPAEVLLTAMEVNGQKFLHAVVRDLSDKGRKKKG